MHGRLPGAERSRQRWKDRLVILQGGAGAGWSRGLASWLNEGQISDLVTSLSSLSLLSCKMGIRVCASWVWLTCVGLLKLKAGLPEEAGGKAEGYGLE